MPSEPDGSSSDESSSGNTSEIGEAIGTVFSEDSKGRVLRKSTRKRSHYNKHETPSATVTLIYCLIV